ncbi:GNAT family N-acetyltransferase [Streptomyces sp. NPDC004008]
MLHVCLTRIELHPYHQGRGIGSQLIRTPLHQARQQGRDLALDVPVVNERAQSLYQRPGPARRTTSRSGCPPSRLSLARSTDLDNDSGKSSSRSCGCR